jgi:hypothetical protein
VSLRAPHKLFPPCITNQWLVNNFSRYFSIFYLAFLLVEERIRDFLSEQFFLWYVFASYGKLLDVRILTTRDVAYVNYGDVEGAVRATAEANGQSFGLEGGRALNVVIQYSQKSNVPLVLARCVSRVVIHNPFRPFACGHGDGIWGGKSLLIQEFLLL